MVCVPCFIVPLLLYIWHKFVQPILLRYWNPWEKKDAEGNVIKAGPEFPFECKGGVCPFVPGGTKQEQNANGDRIAGGAETGATTETTTATATKTTTTAATTTKMEQSPSSTPIESKKNI
ncbi:UPF0729 protein GD16342 [Drosophila mojavensis]|uniref:Uncharacterized protein n=1 Tax=Drosophila mojavensis TaxID=7230 RepID=B4L8B0_DROMO|nr:UPF0729 protein GD16342 [Drosophila mojavensis]EDW05685.1 uncharacterized protein Dmoj_GI10951 [Drosophila mojavensis]